MLYWFKTITPETLNSIAEIYFTIILVVSGYILLEILNLNKRLDIKIFLITHLVMLLYNIN